MSILIGTEVEIWVTSEADPDDDEWSTESTEGYVSNVWACMSDQEPRTWSESFIIDAPEGFKAGDTLYAVVADYSDGDSFGQYGGYSQVLDGFTDLETASALANAADQAERDDYGHKDYDWDFEFQGKEYHRSWRGYFKILNSVDVWQVTVLGSPVDPYRQGSYAVGHKVG